MLIKQEHLEGIKAKRISLAFRQWRRPTVRAGGRLRTAVGELAIAAVDVVTAGEVTDIDARQAGFSSRDELITELHRRREGDLYRIRLHFVEADPRVALRRSIKVTGGAFEQIDQTLRRLDANSRRGPWTMKVRQDIAAHPGRSAAELAVAIRAEKHWLKINIRKLKSLGLTESLSVGYRLSARGKVVLRRIESKHTRAIHHR